MATAFDNLAPRVIADLMRELDLTAAQAAGIVGNLGAESGLLAVQEGHPLAGRGGFGWAQWTGPRRVAFEEYCRDNALDKESYVANLGYLVKELKTGEARAIRQLKRTSTAKAAAETFGYWFERFAGFKNLASSNYARRIQLAERALRLYQTAHPTEVPVPTVPVPTPTPIPDVSRDAIPFWLSKVLQGAFAVLITSGVAVVKVYRPDVPLVDQVDTLWPPVSAALAGLWVIIGRVTSTAQPLTTSQDHADIITAARSQPPLVPVPEAWTAPAPAEPEEARPLREVSLQKLADEMPDVIELLGGLAATIQQIQGVASKIGQPK